MSVQGTLTKQASIGFVNADMDINKVYALTDNTITEITLERYTVPATGSVNVNFGTVTTGKIFFLKSGALGLTITINGSIIVPCSGFFMNEMNYTSITLSNSTASPMTVDTLLAGI